MPPFAAVGKILHVGVVHVGSLASQIEHDGFAVSEACAQTRYFYVGALLRIGSGCLDPAVHGINELKRFAKHSRGRRFVRIRDREPFQKLQRRADRFDTLVIDADRERVFAQ